MKSRHAIFALCAAAALGLNVAPRDAFAVTKSWNVAAGTWGNSANWSPAGAPTQTDSAFVNYLVNGNRGVVAFEGSSTITALSIGQLNEVNIRPNSALLAAGGIDVGYGASVGYLNLNSVLPGIIVYNGRVTSGNNIRLGTSGGFGIVSQNDGVLTTNNALRVGDNKAIGGVNAGTGRYNLSGFGVVNANCLQIGYGLNTAYACEGEFNLGGNASLNAGSFTSAPNIGGNNGIGTLNQTNGTFSSTAIVTIGGTSGAGIYHFSGGTFNGPGINLGNTGTINYTGGANFALGALSTSNGHINLGAGGGKTLRISTLATSAGSWMIDVNDSQMVVSATSGESIAAAVARARNAGAWNGAGGITSTAARNNAQRTSTLSIMSGAEFHTLYGADALFGGQAVTDTQTLVKYTSYGDSDNNGAVNFDDYARIDAGFNNHHTGWVNGDFDSNGVINFDDYSLIDLAFNTQPPAATRALPEPAIPGVLAVSLLLTARRSSRRHP